MRFFNLKFGCLPHRRQILSKQKSKSLHSQTVLEAYNDR